MNKIAQTKFSIIDLIKNRWSPRSFSNRPVQEETIFSLFEAASWSPSSRNEQPWRFICGIKDKGDNYDKIFSTLVEWNQKWAISAPVLAVGLIKVHSEHKDQVNIFAQYDLGQSLAYLTLQAMANNIYVHQMGGFDKKMIRRIFDISAEYEPLIAFSIGYLGLPEDLADDYREMEQKPRIRFDLNKILFMNEFTP